MKLVVFSIILCFWVTVNSLAQTILPTSWNCTPPFPTGYTSNLTTNDFYANSGVNNTSACKFSATGKYLAIQFSDAPEFLNFYIKANTSSGSPFTGTFDVQESQDGINWNSVKTFVGSNVNISNYVKESLLLSKTSQYVRFYFTNKAGGNIGIDDIEITLAPVGSEAEINISSTK